MPTGRQAPSEQMGMAVRMFYSGMSYKQIAETMADAFNIPEPSKSTLYDWVNIAESYPAPGRAAPGGTALRFTAPNSDLKNDLSISLGCFVPPRTEDTHPAPPGAESVPRSVEMMVALLLPES